jgi:hypothetical protein
MRTRIGILAVLGIVLAGCGAAPSSSARPPVASFSPSQAAATRTPAAASGPPASATPRPTPRTAPPAPTAVRITRDGCYTGPDGDSVPSGVCTQTVTWKEAMSAGTEIRVYGVTRCVLQTERATDGRCLGRGTRVPAALRTLIAKAPASAGTVSWTRPAWLDNVRNGTGQPVSRTFGVDRDGDVLYFGIVVAAYNAAGHSAFVLADSGTWCYDTGCVGP